MKKNILVSVLATALLATGLTACGSKPNVEPPRTEVFHGEGEIQGGIKSDEDLARIEEEVKQYDEAKNDSKEDSNNSDMLAAGEAANVEMETPDPISTYISADNFWQGDDYFDLENYLYMNGATSIITEGLTPSFSFEQRDHDISLYRARFSNPYWIVTIQTGGIGSVEFRYNGYLIDGEPVFSPVHTAMPSVPAEDQRPVTVDDKGTVMTDTIIQVLDKMMFLAREYPEDDNPFQYNDDTNLFFYNTSTNVPAGAVKR